MADAIHDGHDTGCMSSGGWEFEGEYIQGNIIDRISIQSQSILESFFKYRRYGFPYGGGWQQQPAKIIKGFDIIEDEIQKIENKKAKKK